MRYHLAIDIGASNGRAILGHMEPSGMQMEEIYRFPNGMHKTNGHQCWDVDALLGHVVTALQKCGEIGRKPDSLGIDTWGVDYVLLDENGRRLGDAVAYRDERTKGMPEKLDKAISFSNLYALTGIARQEYNTLYQMMADFEEHPQYRAQAKGFLFMPCYLSALLCGVAKNEYTIASTSGLLNARTRAWDETVIKAAGLPQSLFACSPVPSGTTLGSLLPRIRQQVGFNCSVMLPACHDTASAFWAIPSKTERSVYLSSGTWSLLGVEAKEPITNENALKAGFTNEGCADGKIRCLQNIMGMWLLQSIRRQWNDRYTHAEIAAIAQKGSGYSPTFDVTDERFLAPKDMIQEILSALTQSGQPAPKDEAELLYCVHNSLAKCYGRAVENLKKLTGQEFAKLHIVGGGSQNQLLNRLTRQETGLELQTGPIEGSVLGNLLAQAKKI